MQTSLPNQQPSVSLQVEADLAGLSEHVASRGRSTRLLWTGFGFALFMLSGLSTSRFCCSAPHVSAKFVRLDAELASFLPPLSAHNSAGTLPARTPSSESASATRSVNPIKAGMAMSRRHAVGLGAVAGTFVATEPLAAFASLDPNDMSRFKEALKGVNYLLDNWETATQECTASGNGVCTDQPDKVRYYFGLRTTDHPLFNLDKLFAKAQKKLPDDVEFDQWIEATESLASQIAKINELAYTSSFGEYNPGGGKEQVRKYLLLCQEQVVLSKASLENIIRLLKI